MRNYTRNAYFETMRMMEACDKGRQFSRGAWAAYRAWHYNTNDDGEIEANDTLFPGDAKDFAETMHKAGIRSFVYTNESTAAVQNFCEFMEAGYSVAGPCAYKGDDRGWKYERLGVRFVRND